MDLSRAPSVSVIVLAFNEAKSLPAAVNSIQKAVEGKFSRYEIIIVNDGSRDDTIAVTEKLASEYPFIKVVHNPQNMGCGYTFLRGVKEAGCEYVWLIPGDGEIPTDSLEKIADCIGKADMIIPYMLNSHIRPLERRIISQGYTTLINILFHKNLRYYNGPCVIKTKLVLTAPTVQSRGFAFMAPILLRLIKRKHSYVQVGIMLQPRNFGKPSIGSLKNILNTLKTLAWVFWDINIAEPMRKNGKRAAKATAA